MRMNRYSAAHGFINNFFNNNFGIKSLLSWSPKLNVNWSVILDCIIISLVLWFSLNKKKKIDVKWYKWNHGVYKYGHALINSDLGYQQWDSKFRRT